MQSTRFCCIATVDQKGVWTNPVFFAWDDAFNLYFISQMHSRHMQNLQKDSNISISIYNTEQKDDVAGVQLIGSAHILTNSEEIRSAFNTYYTRAGKGRDVQQYIDNPTWFFLKVILGNLYYFDTRFFGEERQEVPTHVYRK